MDKMEKEFQAISDIEGCFTLDKESFTVPLRDVAVIIQTGRRIFNLLYSLMDNITKSSRPWLVTVTGSLIATAR